MTSKCRMLRIKAEIFIQKLTIFSIRQVRKLTPATTAIYHGHFDENYLNCSQDTIFIFEIVPSDFFVLRQYFTTKISLKCH